MKKIIVCMLFIINIFKVTSCIASEIDFQAMLERKQIPIKNVNGLEINEQAYRQSGLFVYGTPQSMNNSQRWKNKQDGSWLIEDKDGKIQQGEYWILGENYIGGAVYNPKFPMVVQSNLEKQWEYVRLPNSEESWLYKIENNSVNQRKYMFTQNFYQNNVAQGETTEELGIEKVKIEKVATWQTSGMVSTKKINQDQIEWVELFEIKPMAERATLQSNISAKGGPKFVFQENEDEIVITINYGASVQDAGDFASANDVKTIQSSLYINGLKVDGISASQKFNIQKEYHLVVQKNEEGKPPFDRIHLKCSSFMQTYFVGDSIYQNTVDAELTLWLADELPEDEPENEDEKIVNVVSVIDRKDKGAMPKITEIEIKRVVLNARGNEELVNLLTSQKHGIPFACAGHEINIRVKTINETESVGFEIAGDKSIQTVDELTTKFEIEEPKERKISSKYQSIYQLRKLIQLPKELTLEEDQGNGTKIFSTRYIIPYGAKQTLHSWNSLREKNKNAFQINEEDLFSRITQPYLFYFKARSEVGTTTNIKKIDVFETWNTLYNRDLTKYVK